MRKAGAVFILLLVTLVCLAFRTPCPPDLTKLGELRSPLFSGRSPRVTDISHQAGDLESDAGDVHADGNGPTGAGSGQADSKVRGKTARLAIVIDDVSVGREGLALLTRVEDPLSFALLVGSERDVEFGRRLAQSGRDVLLHLPMEPISRKADPGPNAVRVSMDDEEIRDVVRRYIRMVPFAVGVNNHMGSLATSDSRVMGVVLEEVGKAGLFFLDSVTSPRSVASPLGKKLGVRVLQNSLFIDNIGQKEEIFKSLLEAARIAKRRGSTIVIGHPSKRTAESIVDAIPVIKSMGVRIVPVSDMVPLTPEEPST